MKRVNVVLRILTLLLVGFSSQILLANEVKLGDLSIDLPDSMERIEIKGRDYATRSGDDLIMSIATIGLEGKDENKINEKGDWLSYPFLKDATLVKTETEPWYDWVHNYRKNSYTYEENGRQLAAYTYHMNANGNRYIILMTPYTDNGEEMVKDIMNKGVRNNGWFSNAILWWMLLFGIIFMWMLFIIDPDNSYSIGAHLKWGIIALVVFSIIAYLTMRTNLEYFWNAFLVALIIVVVVPPLRKPIVWIMDHVDG